MDQPTHSSASGAHPIVSPTHRSAALAPLILITDDEPYFREIFSLKLESAGYRVITASSGADCLEKCVSSHPALILMDVQMPVLSGIETVMKLRDIPDMKHTKVIFLTNLGEPKLELQGADRLYARQIGADGYLRKTDDLESLVEHVRIYLGT
jgi:CheY-like chemotaxis protein